MANSNKQSDFSSGLLAASAVKEAERLLGCVRGVISAKIAVSPGGGIEEVSLVARADRPQNDVVRDASGVFRARLGIDLDPDAVRLALVYDDERAESSSGRLQLERITTRNQGEVLRVAVQVSGGGRSFFGWGEGRQGQNVGLRLVAGAALQAVGGHLGNVDVFALEKVVPVDFGERRAVAVSLAFRDFGGEEFFDGLSTVRVIEAEAAARATLDAVNRRVRFVEYSKGRRGFAGSDNKEPQTEAV